MTEELNVTLEWNGPYTSADRLPNRAGLYMILAGKQNQKGNWSDYTVIDIGQSGRTGERLATHDREQCWENNTPDGYTTLFKYALMPSSEYDDDDRRAAECCLRAHHRPLPCGTECNKGYTSDEAVSIANTGRSLPLKSSYVCKPA